MKNNYREEYRDICKAVYQKQIKIFKEFKIKHEKKYGRDPSEKVMIAFCKLRKIEYPIISEEEFIKKG